MACTAILLRSSADQATFAHTAVPDGNRPPDDPDKREGPRRGPSLSRRTPAWLLGVCELSRLVDDDLAPRDLRRLRQRRLELLVAQPVGCDAGRLVGLRRSVEEPDGAQDAVAGVDDLIAAESRELAQAGNKALVDLLDDVVDAGLVDRLVTTYLYVSTCCYVMT
jgi:hypothetical protein